MNDRTIIELALLEPAFPDWYVPEFAEYALEGVRALPEEAFSLVFGFAADRAREEITCN